MRTEAKVGWDGLGVLLPGVEISIVDVASKPRIDDIAAAHDTTQTATRWMFRIESTLMIRMACRVDRKTDLSALARPV